MASVTEVYSPSARRRWRPWPILRQNRTESRERRARTLEAGLAERRRLERDLHDGAQQRLVSLVLTLRTVESRLDQDPSSARGLVALIRGELEAALRDAPAARASALSRSPSSS